MEQMTINWDQPQIAPTVPVVAADCSPLSIQGIDDDNSLLKRLLAGTKLESREVAEDFMVEMCRSAQHTIIWSSCDEEAILIVNEAADAMGLTVHKVRTSETGELWCEPEFADGETEGIVLIDDNDFVGAGPATLAVVYEVILDPPEGAWVCMLGNRTCGDSLSAQLPTSIKMKFATCEI